MDIHLVIFDDGFDRKVEGAWLDGSQANQRMTYYNGEDDEGLGPYEVQTVEISDGKEV